MEPGIYLDVLDNHRVEVIASKDGVLYCMSLIDGHNFQVLESEVKDKWVLEADLTEAANVVFGDD